MKRSIKIYSSIFFFLSFLLCVGSLFVLIESFATNYLGDQWFSVFSLFLSHFGGKFNYIFQVENKGFMDFFVFGIFVLLLTGKNLILISTAVKNFKTENIGLNIFAMIVVTIDLLAYTFFMFDPVLPRYIFCLIYRIVLLFLCELRLQSIKHSLDNVYTKNKL